MSHCWVDEVLEEIELTQELDAMSDSELHCWEAGPETEDGCSTTCMLIDGHDGPHLWTRDDQIGITFT